MNAMVTHRGVVDDRYRPSPLLFSTDFGSVALAANAARRRSRIQDIETDIDRACEREALRHRRSVSGMREAWDRRTWRRYVAEAIRQTRFHAAELGWLRREAADLERLSQTLDGRSVPSSATQPPSEG